jgi:DNA processing protein
MITLLKTANARFREINIPDPQAAKIAWDKAHEILKRSEQQNIEIISRESLYYPECLSLISNLPVLLHVKGNLKALNKNSIAIVGTRNPSGYGKNRAKEIAKLFINENYVVVSGLAQGVDSAAHMGALEAKGLTVAVLAHGLDTIYPYLY